MSAVFAIVLALGGTSTSSVPSDWFELVQGRATNVIEVAKAAKRCAFRTANANVTRGLPVYRRPDDQGGSLELRKAEATPAARRCLRKKIPAFRKRYRDLEFFSDTL